MAEILGTVASGITLAALFKLCIEAFDLIQTFHNQALDLQKLTLRLNIEKCRLYTWGEAMGLTAPADNGRRPLESFDFKTLVQETLEMLLRLFSDTSKIQARYGCREVSFQKSSVQAFGSLNGANPIDNLATCFTNFTVAGGKRDSSIKKKALWVVQDRKKFGELITEVKDLIDGLQEVTKTISTAIRQEQILTHRIQQIEEAETLHLVSSVCEVDHPSISDAASVKLEVMSMASTRRGEIEHWTDGILDSDLTSSDIESLSITELKHIVRRLMDDESRTRVTGAHSGNLKSGPVELDRAIKFVTEVKNRFTDEPEVYKQFLEIFQTYLRGSMTIRDVFDQVKHLFKTAPELMEDFNRFLPESAAQAEAQAAAEAVAQAAADKATVPTQVPSSPDPATDRPSIENLELSSRTPAESLLLLLDLVPKGDLESVGAWMAGQEPTVKDAEDYLDQVKIRFENQPNVWNEFLDIMKDFKAAKADIPSVMSRVSYLFKMHPSLIEGFNRWLPPGYRIDACVDGNPDVIKVTTPEGTYQLAAQDVSSPTSRSRSPPGPQHSPLSPEEPYVRNRDTGNDPQMGNSRPSSPSQQSQSGLSDGSFLSSSPSLFGDFHKYGSFGGMSEAPDESADLTAKMTVEKSPNDGGEELLSEEAVSSSGSPPSNDRTQKGASDPTTLVVVSSDTSTISYQSYPPLASYDHTKGEENKGETTLATQTDSSPPGFIFQPSGFWRGPCQFGHPRFWTTHSSMLPSPFGVETWCAPNASNGLANISPLQAPCAVPTSSTEIHSVPQGRKRSISDVSNSREDGDGGVKGMDTDHHVKRRKLV